MILYGTQVNGTNHEMGTSGFLYRSNKLMYDRATMSLWSTLWGKPVIGPLVNSGADKGIELEQLSVVTTTWGEWRKRHPDTKVLSLDTGHNRNYSEGEAYRNYFSTHELMFPVPKADNRLENKDEILALQMMGAPPVAVSVAYLARHPVAKFQVGASEVVVLTDRSGANRVYETQGIKFEQLDGNHVVDEQGDSWSVTEAELIHPDGRRLARQPAHRAFWFGWRAAYPQTRLIK